MKKEIGFREMFGLKRLFKSFALSITLCLFLSESNQVLFKTSAYQVSFNSVRQNLILEHDEMKDELMIDSDIISFIRYSEDCFNLTTNQSVFNVCISKDRGLEVKNRINLDEETDGSFRIKLEVKAFTIDIEDNSNREVFIQFFNKFDSISRSARFGLPSHLASSDNRFGTGVFDYSNELFIYTVFGKAGIIRTNLKSGSSMGVGDISFFSEKKKIEAIKWLYDFKLNESYICIYSDRKYYLYHFPDGLPNSLNPNDQKNLGGGYTKRLFPWRQLGYEPLEFKREPLGVEHGEILF